MYMYSDYTKLSALQSIQCLHSQHKYLYDDKWMSLFDAKYNV